MCQCIVFLLGRYAVTVIRVSHWLASLKEPVSWAFRFRCRSGGLPTSHTLGAAVGPGTKLVSNESHLVRSRTGAVVIGKGVALFGQTGTNNIGLYRPMFP